LCVIAIGGVVAGPPPGESDVEIKGFMKAAPSIAFAIALLITNLSMKAVDSSTTGSCVE
jgi:hypothetical protein